MKYKSVSQVLSPSSLELFRPQPITEVQGLDGQMQSCAINENNTWSLYGATKMWLIYCSGSTPYLFSLI